MTVYLLHYTGEDKSVRHYLGFTSREPETRLAEHVKGYGGKYTSRLLKLRYSPEIAHLFPGESLTFEKRLKLLSRNNPYFRFGNWCPLCGVGHPIPEKHQVMDWKNWTDYRG